MYKNASNHWVRYSLTSTIPEVYNNAGSVVSLGSVKYGVYRIGIGEGDLNSTSVHYYGIINNAQFNNQAAAETAINTG